MPFRLGPLKETFTPARWPELDYSRNAEVARAWLPADVTVGHLAIQDNMSVAWLASVGPDDPAAYAARTIVQDILTEALAEGVSARDTWDRAQEAILFEAPEIVPLPELVKKLRKEWLK